MRLGFFLHFLTKIGGLDLREFFYEVRDFNDNDVRLVLCVFISTPV